MSENEGKAKKAAACRVYPVTDTNGDTRYIEATSAAAAITHVYAPKVGRPLTGSEVAAAVRDGHAIEQAKV